MREAERWGDDELQDLGRAPAVGRAVTSAPRRWAASAAPATLDPAGTDFAIRTVRASWKYHSISAERLAADLAGLPAKLDHVDSSSPIRA